MKIVIKTKIENLEIKRKFIVGFKYTKTEKCKKSYDEFNREVLTHWFDYTTEAFVYELKHKPNSFKKYYGYSYCSYMDEYNKGVGQFIALKKALDEMTHDYLISEEEKIKLVDGAQIDESYKKVYDVPNLGLKITDELVGEVLTNLEKKDEEARKKHEEEEKERYSNPNELPVANVEDDNTECAVLGAMELVGDKDEQKIAHKVIKENNKAKKKVAKKSPKKSSKK